MPAEVLSHGLQDLGLETDSAQEQLLLDYLNLLSHWNKTYNLTAVRDEHAMVTRHLLDSLSVFPHLRGRRIIDVGSGAGLPGIPLAIVSPTKQFALLDSNGKKTRFLVHAVNKLGLNNVEVIKSRVTEYIPVLAFDSVLSRAFASLDDMISSCQHLLAPNGEFLAMKGQRPDAELKRVEPDAYEVSLIDLQVPGLAEDRCLIRIRLQANRDKQ